MAHLTADPTNPERWVCLYPGYINRDFTGPMGRRVPKEICPSNPTLQEIKSVLEKQVKLEFRVEEKFYRDLSQVGRFRIKLKEKDGQPCNSKFPTRKSVFKFVADTIRTSTARVDAEKKQEALEAAKEQKAIAEAAATSNPGSSKKSKRGGKKGRR